MKHTKKQEIFIKSLEHLKNEYDFQFDPMIPAIIYKAKKEKKYSFLNPYDFNSIWCDLILVWDIKMSSKDLKRAIDLLSVPININLKKI